MKKSLILLALVTACGASDQNRQDAQAVAQPTQAPSSSVTPVGRSASLTGLYEGGAGEAHNQLCIVEKGGTANFGLVTWGPNLSACGGAGIVERDGDRLQFRMTGDQACTVAGRMEGGMIRLEGPVPKGCAYYCGARAGFQGTTFARKGATTNDAMKAKDPAGDPLCSN